MIGYIEKLRDPRWQKRRLEVFEAAKFSCECCGDTKRTLHVHHLRYVKCEPWEAKDEDLECLCEVCHEFRTDFDKFYEKSSVPTKKCWEHFCSWKP